MSVAPPRTAPSKKPPVFLLSPDSASTPSSPFATSPTTNPSVAPVPLDAAANLPLPSPSSAAPNVPLEKTQSFVNLTTSALQGVFGSHTSLAELAGDLPSSPRPGRAPAQPRYAKGHQQQLHPHSVATAKHDKNGSLPTSPADIDLDAANFLLENPRPRRRASTSSFSVGGNKPNGTSFDKHGESLQHNKFLLFPLSHLAPDGTVVYLSSATVALRLGALFAFGVAFGQLAKNLHDNQQVRTHIFNLDTASHSPAVFSLIWGLHAVVLGILLPAIDKAFPSGSIKPATLSASSSIASTRPSSVDSAAAAATAEEEKEQQQEKGGTDWVSVIRGSAAFLGLAYGVRKLPWESSAQVALLWGSLNPILWYLFDGTSNGFVVSSATAIIETMGFAALLASHLPPADMSTAYLTVVTWVASVFFCCSICFGNLGRRILTN